MVFSLHAKFWEKISKYSAVIPIWNTKQAECSRAFQPKKTREEGHEKIGGTYPGIGGYPKVMKTNFFHNRKFHRKLNI